MLFIIDNVIVWGLAAATVFFMATSIAHVHEHISLSTTRGFFWLLAILVGNLLGVILYRLFRGQVENLCETMFERW